MAQSFRFQISVDCDVENADSEAVARTAAFALLTAVQQSKRGRKAAGLEATITGVKITGPEGSKGECCKPAFTPRTTDVVEG